VAKERVEKAKYDVIYYGEGDFDGGGVQCIYRSDESMLLSVDGVGGTKRRG
jgi:hypothetical protein